MDGEGKAADAQRYEYHVAHGDQLLGVVDTADAARVLLRDEHDAISRRAGGHTIASGRCPCDLTERALAKIGEGPVWARGPGTRMWTVDRVEKGSGVKPFFGEPEQRRVEPYVWEWEQDGVKRQINVHYTRIGTTVVYDPRHPDDPLPWFDADYERDSDRGRWEDGDIVTLGPTNAPGYGLIDAEDDIDAPEDFSDVIEDVAPVPSPEQEGTRPMAITNIGDVVNHRALLNALNTIRAEVESRQEDVNNLAAWSAEMADRMQGIAEELKALKLDTYTVGNVNMLGDLIAGSKKAADVYKDATDKSVSQAEIAARTAHRNHGRIQNAVDDADVPMAQNTFYDAE